MTTPVAESDILAAAQVILRDAQKSGRLKHDSPGAPPATGYAHGQAGTFRWPGVDPDVYSTIVGTRPGIMNLMPLSGSLLSDPLYELYTGITDTSGDNAADDCDDGPVAGVSKSGKLTAPFGKFKMSTRELKLDRMALHLDRADPFDLQMVGNPIGDNPFEGLGMNAPNDVLQSEMSMAFYERMVSMHRLISKKVYDGNPQNNVGEAYKEFAGFDLLINTGHVDAVTGTVLPSVDSDIKDFNYAKVEDNGEDLVTFVSEMYRFLLNNAETMGFMPVSWRIVMRRSLWIQLTEVWPCSYFLGGCTEAEAGKAINLDAGDRRDLRDQMRDGRFLLIDGDRVPVVIDDGITEDTTTTNANLTEGCFSSDIYFIPMTVLGGRTVTFWEYQQYQNNDVQRALGRLGGDVIVTDGGQFLDFARRTNLCVQWEMQFSPRIIMRTPWLAGRIQNVQYCPMQHERESFPEDPYFVDGGLTETSGVSYQSLWS